MLFQTKKEKIRNSRCKNQLYFVTLAIYRKIELPQLFIFIQFKEKKADAIRLL